MKKKEYKSIDDKILDFLETNWKMVAVGAGGVLILCVVMCIFRSFYKDYRRDRVEFLNVVVDKSKRMKQKANRVVDAKLQ